MLSSFDLTTYRVEKDSFFEYENITRIIIQYFTDTSDNAYLLIIHTERKVRAMDKLSQEADIWKIVRGLQLISSKYNKISEMSKRYLEDTINIANGSNIVAVRKLYPVTSTVLYSHMDIIQLV